jgi:hypothetical protein
MIYGFTPFKADNRNETFRNILKRDVEFPLLAPIVPGMPYVVIEKHVKDLLKHLLIKVNFSRD